jgi:hypothetical protein
MDFTLTETQTLLQDTANRLVRERYSFEERKKIIAAGSEFVVINFDGLAVVKDEIIKGVALTRDGQVIHPQLKDGA